MTPELGTEQLIARAKEAFARDAYLPALEDLEEVLRRAPHYADVYHLAGLCRALLGRPEDALEAFTHATELNPGYVEAHLSRAILLGDLGRYDEAQAAYERAAAADAEKGGGRFPSSVAAQLANKHQELGDLYAGVGALREAVEQYTRAVVLRPRFVDIRNKLARCLVELGDVDAAVEELRRVLEVNPAFVAARANLRLALQRRGESGRARAEWQRCLEQQPENAQVQAYLTLLERS